MKRIFPVCAAALAALCVIFSCVAPVGFTPEGAIKVDATVEGEVSVTTPDAVLLVHNHLKSMDVQTLEIVDNDSYSLVAQSSGKPKAGFQKLFSLRPKSTAYTVKVKLFEVTPPPPSTPNHETHPDWQWSGDGVEKSYEIFMRKKGLYNLHLFRYPNGSIGLTEDPAEYNRDKTSEDDQMSRTDPDDGKEGSTDPDPGSKPDMRYGLLVVKNMSKYQDIERVYFTWYEDPAHEFNIAEADKLYTMEPGPGHHSQRSIQLGPNDWKIQAEYRVDGVRKETEVTVVTVNQAGQEWYAYFYKNLDGDYAITTEWPPADWADENTAFIPVTNISGLVSYAVKDQILTLTGQVEPANADRQNVLFSIKSGGNIPIVFVDDNRIKPMGTGAIQMRATVPGGKGNGVDFTTDFSITVGLVAPSFIAVNNISGIPETITAGETINLNSYAVVNPSDATNQAIEWLIMSPQPIGGDGGINASGNFTATITGEYKIQATILNGKANSGTDADFVKEFTITVEAAPYISVQDIKNTSIQATMYVGQSQTLTGTIYPASATAAANGITWTVSPASHASISGSTLTLNSNTGIITITASVPHGLAVGQAYTKNFNVEIKQQTPNIKPVTAIAIKLDGETIANGHTAIATTSGYTVSGTITPADATYTNIVWSVQNGTGTATVNNSTGKFLPGGKGTVTLTATIKDADNSNHFVATRQITVFVPATGVTRSNPPEKARIGYKYLLEGAVNASATNTAIGSWSITSGSTFAEVSQENGKYYFTGTATGTAGLQAAVTNGETPTTNKTLPAGTVTIIDAESNDTSSPGLVILGPDTVYTQGSPVTYTGRPIPESANVTFTWSVAGAGATINASGQLTPTSAGPITIIASCTAGSSKFEVRKAVTIVNAAPPPQAYLKIVRKDSGTARLADITGYGTTLNFSDAVKQSGQSTYSLSSTANPLAAGDRDTAINFRQAIPTTNLTSVNSTWTTTAAQGKYLVAFGKTNGTLFGYDSAKWLALDIPWFVDMGMGTMENPIVLEINLSSNTITIPTNPNSPISGKAWIKVTMGGHPGNMFYYFMGNGYGNRTFPDGQYDGESGISVNNGEHENGIDGLDVPLCPFNKSYTSRIGFSMYENNDFQYNDFSKYLLVNIEPYLLAYKTEANSGKTLGYIDNDAYYWFLLDVAYKIGGTQVAANGLGSYTNPIVVELAAGGGGIQFPGITVGGGGSGTTTDETAAIKFVPTSDYAGSGSYWHPGNVILHPIISTTTAYFDPTRQASGNSGIPALAGTALPNGVTTGAKVEVNLTGSGFASSGGISKNNLPIGRYLVKVDWAYSSYPSYPTGYNTSTWFLLDLPYKLGTTTTPGDNNLGGANNPLILYVNPESIRYSGSSGSGGGGAMVRFIRTDDTMPPNIDFIQAFSTPYHLALDNGDATPAQLLEGNSKIPVNLIDNISPQSPPIPVVNASVGPFNPGGRRDIAFPQLSSGESYLLRYSISPGGVGMGEDRGYTEVYSFSYTYYLFYLDIDRWEQRGYGSADNPILIYISADGGMEFSPEMTEDTYVTVGVLPVPNNPSTIPYGLHLFRVEYPGQVFGVIETGEAGETFSSITSLGNPGFHTSPSMVSYTGPSGDNYNLFKIPSGQYFVQTESVKDGAHYYAGYSQTQWFYLDTETIRSLAEFGHPGTRNNPINILLTRNANGTTCIKMQYQGLIIHP